MIYKDNPSFSEAVGGTARETGFGLYDAVLINAARGVWSRYVHTPANFCNDSYSVAKAFTMTAVGMLVSDGKLSVTDHVTDILRAELPEEYDRRWDAVTLHNALTHKMGLDEGYLDIDCEDVRAYPSRDYLALTVRRELPHEPGTVSRYSDAAFYLLSRVVTAISGEKLDDFLMSRLFSPLDFAEMAWSRCPHGFPMGATGLYIRTEDMAKLGLVYLCGGEYLSKRIIPQAWVETALREGYEFHPCGEGAFGKGGMLGQMLAFFPTAQKVIAWHGYDTGSNTFGQDIIAKVSSF